MTMTKTAMHKILCIRLGDQADQALLHLMKTLGTKTRSRVVRKMIMEAAGLGPDLLNDNLDSFREGVRQLAALGNNINQIARAINSGQAPGCPWDSELMNAVIRRLRDHQKVVADIATRSKNRWTNHG
jgi:hypothetical protein